MKILGISAFYHDSAAALIIDGEIVAAAQEERFTRKKADHSFPVNAINYCLHHEAISIIDLDAVVFYDKPLLKFERLLETYYGFSPKGVASFVTAIPAWIKEKVFLKKIIHDELSKIGSYSKKDLKLLFPEHHLSHAASAFFASPYKEAAILTIDGVGEWATASLGYGSGNTIKNFKELHFPHSVGLLYSAFTYFLGFRVNSGEYKLMGLAPYGIPGSKEVETYIQIIKSKLVKINEDGSVWLNQKYFHYATGLRMVQDKKWEKLFGFKRRLSEAEIEQHHANLAYAIQLVTEEIVIAMARELKKLTNSENLCLAGGVALNCVANGKLEKEGLFENIFVQPAAGDAGGAVGAAYAAYHLFYGNKREESDTDKMMGSYLGPEFSDQEIAHTAKSFSAVYRKIDEFKDLAQEAAQIISDGNVVGWFQGRMEFGPRALGNRSILGDARNKDMQLKLNLKIKYRESFRPFAPSVLTEDMKEYFDLINSSPYMLMVGQVKEKYLNKLPENYQSLPIRERLYVNRSQIPAITHIDLSARVQSVHKETNPRYWELINAYKKISGFGLIVNTSFNVRGEPIVCTPEEAYRCFMRTEMDYLVMGDFIFNKTEQPAWNQKSEWQEEFKLD
ncbi:MAG: carbamoyltransferase [Bacteroidales bacterium]|nr:carbamoyltransferase [Bacteroidales bacterium]MCF8390061.1 carbamoyltransferase [Bacteroidales bacterium]